MQFAMFYHSLLSDWNHGNAHFLRGIVTELQSRGHKVRVYEPADGWSLRNLQAEHGDGPLQQLREVYPTLETCFYDADRIDLDRELDGTDAVLVHEWNEPELVARIGRHHNLHRDYALLFHDTHHRSATASEEMSRYDLRHYDGVLAYGGIIREIYLDRGWADQVWTWHEAADTRVFHPPLSRFAATNGDGSPPTSLQQRDLVWIGNWGDGERSEELTNYLIEPVRRLNLETCVHGVRYPAEGRDALASAGIEFAGWLPNYHVPQAFAEARATIHLPRRPYRESLTGIPTIRVFEALACGIPLICLNWDDSEHLFTPGEDYLVVDTPRQMTDALRAIFTEPELAHRMTAHGLATIRDRHTCANRVDELLAIIAGLGGDEIDQGGIAESASATETILGEY